MFLTVVKSCIFGSWLGFIFCYLVWYFVTKSKKREEKDKKERDACLACRKRQAIKKLEEEDAQKKEVM